MLKDRTAERRHFFVIKLQKCLARSIFCTNRFINNIVNNFYQQEKFFQEINYGLKMHVNNSIKFKHELEIIDYEAKILVIFSSRHQK